MAINKTPNQIENELLDKKNAENLETASLPSAEFKEPTAEAKETGETRETETQAGEEKIVEPGIIPVKYAPLPPRPEPKPIRLKQVESILSEDLQEAFLNLSPEQQLKFKAEGEKTAATIYQMLESAKVQVKKIVELISKWLKRLPGVNKYFIEQESKIKTDKIINLIKKDGQ
ncbi:MAG TPA: hypothetical protein PKY08_03680 [Candidatus Magasanikbacteria bacterium]|nr:hypothetical protein [Candidatus Magasanikbacteria bacterium]